MADTCVKMCHCGAPYPGWLTGGHPSVEDGAVMRKVCFVGRRGCCEAWAYITVRNCSGFYVYHLSRPSSYCNYGYCASTGFEEPTTLTTGKSSFLKLFIVMGVQFQLVPSAKIIVFGLLVKVTYCYVHVRLFRLLKGNNYLFTSVF